MMCHQNIQLSMKQEALAQHSLGLGFFIVQQGEITTVQSTVTHWRWTNPP